MNFQSQLIILVSLYFIGNATAVRNVRFADEQGTTGNGLNSSSTASSTSGSAASSGAGSGSSGPSSIESVQKPNNSGLYDETLVVIEKSNKELEKKLITASEVNVTTATSQQPQSQSPSSKQPPPLLVRPRLVDTIHNNKNSLAQEIIYEVEPGSQENSMIIGKY